MFPYITTVTWPKTDLERQIRLMAVFFFIAHKNGFKFHLEAQTGAYNILVTFGSFSSISVSLFDLIWSHVREIRRRSIFQNSSCTIYTTFTSKMRSDVWESCRYTETKIVSCLITNTLLYVVYLFLHLLTLRYPTYRY